ncbi:DUF2787 domain-containing protein [Colwellia sp. 75C3]|uniref:DUF2787 family protein n=1 Tax=Colwellia sp. 75C3 TaxID=888425 RepID=UPI000C33B4C9|nr:DUF2787 family protein [Colwellia sp. 75C3]PKG84382.1 DUF2787 domain-containing protein [Colwellia sp. 75C3]
MKLTFNKSQRFAVPERLTAILNGELTKIDNAEPGINGITFNFRDDSYSAELGGYHPVEVRIVNSDNLWTFEYITDFSFQGAYPELVKDIDACFLSGQIYTLYSGSLKGDSARELIDLFLTNFISYVETNIFTVTVEFD